MSGLIFIATNAIWLALGWLLWRALNPRRIQSTLLRYALMVTFLGTWVLAPWIDEILGAEHFKRACAATPASKFFGPASLGAGPFFDETGKRKWTTTEQFSAIRRALPDNDRPLGLRSESFVRSRWPIPIVEDHTEVFVKRTNTPVVTWISLRSAGGWIKRSSGWGTHAPYQCPAKGEIPPEEQWITF